MMGQRIGFDAARYEAFQILLNRLGDPDLLAVKRGGAHRHDSSVSSRHAQPARRMAEVQARYLRGEIIEADTEADEDEAVPDHA